jgi:hypothetical protein
MKDMDLESCRLQSLQIEDGEPDSAEASAAVKNPFRKKK